MLTLKQKKFFESLYKVAMENSPKKVLFDGTVCKELTLVIPIDVLEEIRDWEEFIAKLSEIRS